MARKTFNVKLSIQDILFFFPAITITFFLSTLLLCGLNGLKVYLVICGSYTFATYFPFKNLKKIDIVVVLLNLLLLPASVFGFLVSWYWKPTKTEIKNV